MDKKSIESMIEENQKKAAKKREKQGVAASTLNEMAQKNVRNIAEPKTAQMSSKERDEKLQQAAEKNKNAKQGSLAAKANMVREFNESNKNK